MNIDNIISKKWCREYDGYRSDSIWQRDEKESSYFNQITDTQCALPLPSIEDLEKQLEACQM